MVSKQLGRALLLAAAACGGCAEAAQTCGDLALAGMAETAAAPDGMRIDINGDANPDTISDTGLHLNCGDGRHLQLVRSAGPLTTAPDPRGGRWRTLTPAASGMVETPAGRFKLSVPSFWPAPPPPLSFADGRYGTDLPLCAAKNLRAPLVTPVFDGDKAVALTIADPAGGLTVAARDLELAALGAARQVDADGDGTPDLLLAFEDRYGSGRETHAALLLGCGGGAYLLAGEMAADAGALEEVAGGFVGQRTRVSHENPDAAQVSWAAWRLDGSVWSLARLPPTATRAATIEGLKSAR